MCPPACLEVGSYLGWDFPMGKEAVMRKESKWLLSCWFWSTGCMNQSGLDHTPWWKKRCVLSSPSYLSLLFFNRKEKKLVAANSKRHPATARSATRHQLIRLHSFGHRAAQTWAKASFRSIWRTVFAAGDLCPCRFIFILLHSMWSDNAFVDTRTPILPFPPF